MKRNQVQPGKVSVYVLIALHSIFLSTYIIYHYYKDIETNKQINMKCSSDAEFFTRKQIVLGRADKANDAIKVLTLPWFRFLRLLQSHYCTPTELRHHHQM